MLSAAVAVPLLIHEPMHLDRHCMTKPSNKVGCMPRPEFCFGWDIPVSEKLSADPKRHYPLQFNVLTSSGGR